MKTLAWAGLFLSALTSAGHAEPAPPLPVEFSAADTEEKELYRLAGSLFDSKNFPAAAKHFRDFLNRHSRHPRAPDAQMMLAESLYQQALADAAQQAPSEKLLDEARHEFKKALAAIPKGDHLAASAHYRLGEIEFNRRRYLDAIESMAQLKKEFPGDLLRGEAAIVEAQSLLALRRAPEAYGLLRAALKDQPVYEQEPRLALTYGIALYEIGNSSGSLNYLERLDEPMAHLYAARSYSRLGKPLVAVERLKRAIQADPHGPQVELARYLVAEAFFAAKDYASAAQAYELFLRAYPRSGMRPAAMYKVGLCQYERQEYLAARGSFQSVMQLAPNNEFAELALYMIAESFMKENRLKEANFAYGELASSYKTALAGTARFKQGWTHFKQGEYGPAEAALRLMLLDHPGHTLAPAAALLSGNVLTKQERYSDAVKGYQQCLDLLEAGKLPEDRKAALREATLALMSRANLLAKDYASLVSGYQYILKHVKPSLNPWRAATFLYIAEGYFRQRNFEEALAVYKEVLTAFPVTPEAALAAEGTAWAYFAQGQYARSAAERAKFASYKTRPPVAPTKTVIKGGAVDPELFIASEFETATTLFNQKKYLEALDAYEAFLQARPDHPNAPDAGLQAGWCYYRLEHYGQALKMWERVEGAYNSHPVAAKAAWAIADTYFRAGQYDRAIAGYQRILLAYPNDSAANHAKLRIAQSHYNAKEILPAIEAFEALLKEAGDSPEAGQVLDFLTQLLFLPQAKEQALLALNRIGESLGDAPIAASAKFRVARYFYETQDYGSAADKLENLLAGITGQNELIDAQFFLAESYYQLKRYADAAGAYERFTTNFPLDKRFPAALFHLGASRFKLEDYAGAAEPFRQLAADYPDTQYAPVALFNSALAFRKLGRWEEAALALKTYIKRHPDEAKNANALGQLAEIYEEHRQYAMTIEALGEARDVLPSDDPRRVELTHRIAEAHSALGDDAKAMQEYQQAARSPLKVNAFRLAALAKLGEFYERGERWVEALEAYNDLAQNASQKEWVDAARARAQAAREKLAHATHVTSSTATDTPAARPARKKPVK